MTRIPFLECSDRPKNSQVPFPIFRQAALSGRRGRGTEENRNVQHKLCTSEKYGAKEEESF